MRSSVDPQKIEQLMEALGKEARGPGCIYFTGGTSALLIGWRGSTVDVDIRLDPEPSGIFQAIAKLKQELNINIELASPQDFLPSLPGWRDSNSKFRNSREVRHWLALTPTLSQAWEREPESKAKSPAPLLPELGEGVGG
jgi:hypothetical protein